MNVKTGTKLGPYSRTANNLILHSSTVFIKMYTGWPKNSNIFVRLNFTKY